MNRLLTYSQTGWALWLISVALSGRGRRVAVRSWGSLLLFVASVCLAQQPSVTAIINAANFQTTVANSSIVSIFGSNLAAAAASATTDPPPKVLGGVTVNLCPFIQDITCQPAQLLYVGPTQINVVLPFQPGIGSRSVDIVVKNYAGFATQRIPIKLYEQAVGIFQMGWDCPYPANCAFSPVRTGTNTILRGSVTDSAGRLVTSANPLTVKGSYVLYFTGGGFVPDGFARGSAVYSYLIPAGKDSGTVAFPTYFGHSPCCAGLDQLNFSIPQDVLRGFSSDDKSVPSCSTFVFPLRIEMQLVARGTSNESPFDSVSVPVLLNKGDVSCSQ